MSQGRPFQKFATRFDGGAQLVSRRSFAAAVRELRACSHLGIGSAATRETSDGLTFDAASADWDGSWRVRHIGGGSYSVAPGCFMLEGSKDPYILSTPAISGQGWLCVRAKVRLVMAATFDGLGTDAGITGEVEMTAPPHLAFVGASPDEHMLIDLQALTCDEAGLAVPLAYCEGSRVEQLFRKSIAVVPDLWDLTNWQVGTDFFISPL